MGQDQELFFSQPLDYDFGHRLWLESTRGQKLEAQPRFRCEHVGLHSLRAEAGHLDPVIAMCDREPLEE